MTDDKWADARELFAPCERSTFTDEPIMDTCIRHTNLDHGEIPAGGLLYTVDEEAYQFGDLWNNPLYYYVTIATAVRTEDGGIRDRKCVHLPWFEAMHIAHALIEQYGDAWVDNGWAWLYDDADRPYHQRGGVDGSGDEGDE